VPIRLGELPIKQKRIKKRMVLRRFDKNNSVFKAWKIDTEDTLKKSFDLDVGYSKIMKASGSQEAFEEVTSILFDNIRKIKDLFIYGIGISSFPSISWMDFSNMCQHWKIIDKNLSYATIDRVFIATNVELVAQEDNPDRDLCRYEFYEIIVRLAREKYFTTKICSTMGEAVRRLTKEIIERCQDYWPWQSWREEQLWTAKIDDFLKVNLSGLKKLYTT
jgi:hypothetical protein